MREINILGYGPSMVACDFSIETWGMNHIYTYPSIKLDKLFELHSIEQLESGVTLGCVEMLAGEQASRGFELITAVDLPGCTCTHYPLEEIVEHFGSVYLRNTPVLMLAYALYVGCTTVNLPGIDHCDLVGPIGWSARSCVEYWIGRAQGMGVTVRTSRKSDVCTCKGLIYPTMDHRKAYIYPVDDATRTVHAFPEADEILRRRANGNKAGGVVGE